MNFEISPYLLQLSYKSVCYVLLKEMSLFMDLINAF